MKNTLIYKVGFLMMTLIYIGAPFYPSAHAEKPADFFASIQDIPLKPGLVELTDQTITYDKPEGRIIESVAQIKSGSEEEIKHYYEKSLPQLGWNKKSDGSYLRNDEHLKIYFENFEGKRFLHLMIEPY